MGERIAVKRRKDERVFVRIALSQLRKFVCDVEDFVSAHNLRLYGYNGAVPLLDGYLVYRVLFENFSAFLRNLARNIFFAHECVNCFCVILSLCGLVN